MNAIPTTSTGRARTVLVFGAGEAATAAVSTVVARVQRGAGRDRLLFTGPAVYEQKLISHLRQTVLPVVDQIVQRLTAHRRPTTKLKTFEVSTVNLGAASTAEVGLSISGYSADVPVLLALLSAVLRIPLPQDVVTTGHVASSDGDIRFVASIPAKLAAAIQDPSVSRFVFPALDADASLQGLSPAERDRLKAAINEAKGGIRMAAVSDVAQLIRQVVPEESVVLSSLRGSFFESEDRSESSATPIEHAVSFLAADNDERFWRVLERRLLAGNSEATQELLLARSRYHVRRRKYPGSLGRKLSQLVQSLPPATRRMRSLFPLLPRDACLRVCRFAGEDDYEDVQCLMDSAVGKVAGRPRESVAVTETTSTTVDNATVAVEAVLAEIDAEALVRKIGLPIDSARASYVMGDVLIESSAEFNDAVSGFYLTLLRHTYTEPVSANAAELADEALDLLEQAFADKGGVNAARAEARDGIHGGMRFVLDVMTERYKVMQQSKHVSRVLQEALDPLDWSHRVAFMRALIDRLGPHLPAEIRDQPPERFARHYGEIVQTYAQSLDRVKQLLRRL